MQEDLPADFPAEERYTDCAGRAITFALSCHRMPLGWRVAAVEVSDFAHGYEFEACSPASPFLALGEVRGKIRRGLAVKYLAPGPTPKLTHEMATGHITWDAETDEACLVVDGRPISMARLSQLLISYEGWRFELKISDPTA